MGHVEESFLLLIKKHIGYLVLNILFHSFLVSLSSLIPKNLSNYYRIPIQGQWNLPDSCILVRKVVVIVGFRCSHTHFNRQDNRFCSGIVINFAEIGRNGVLRGFIYTVGHEIGRLEGVLQRVILRLQLRTQQLQKIILFRRFLGKNSRTARPKQYAAKKPQ